MARRVLTARVAQDLIEKIEKAEGWPNRASGMNPATGNPMTRSARASTLYVITVDHRRARYVATPRNTKGN